ncbi:MAG: hypothetical protein SNJ11_00350 [Rikenellaceae bacterium]
MKKTLFTVMWIGVVAYIIFAALSVRAHRSKMVVEGVEIKIVDSSAVNNLVTRSMVEGWIKDSRIKITGQKADSLSMESLEGYIKQNGFVKQVKCFTSYAGVLMVEVEQLNPALRILLDGYNCYITSDGFVFSRPASSSHYAPIITGHYSPLFRAGYNGSIHDVYSSQCEEIEAEIKRMEKELLHPLYQRRVEIRDQLREVNKRYINRGFGQSKKAFEKEVEELREKNRQERAKLQRAAYENDMAIERETNKQKLYSEREKKLTKKYKDFINLITFVNVVENDKFWSSEIVQIVASESTSGDLKLELIPRSGSHTIIFGELNDMDEKLDNCKTFYKEVLPSQGWNKFKSINIEYKSQIVCK